jgi:hypothetical protein
MVLLLVERRDRVHQPARVRVPRLAEQRDGWRLLDHLAGVHDDDPVGHLGHDAEVVGDQQHRHVQFLLELLDQLEDLGLDGDIKGRRRLVGDQQLWSASQRHRDHDTLAHAA